MSPYKYFIIIFAIIFSLYFSAPSFFRDSTHSLLPNSKVNLGLDLKGGAYLLLELDYKTYFKEQLERYQDALKAKLRLNKIHSSSYKIGEHSITFSSNGDISEIRKSAYDALSSSVIINSTGDLHTITLSDNEIKEMQNNLMTQSLEIVRRRIDETGTREVDLIRQGDQYILLQVPGAENPDEIKRLLGKTAKLSLHLVKGTYRSAHSIDRTKIPLTSKILPFTDSRGNRTFLALDARPTITGEMLVNASVVIDQGSPIVQFKLNSIGGRIFGEATSKNVNKQLAIVLDDKVISAPVINSPILTGSGIIQGSFSIQSANELALLLRAGALPVPLKIAEERTVGPSLGQDSIKSGTTAAVIGSVSVFVFMFLFYGLFGMFANVALIFNIFLTIALLGILGATLTLPGIAGMVLTIGMAVDANVLIFERIKEEIRNGRSILSGIDSGFKLAYATIIDSNLTTILAAMILFLLGNGPIKGFAITLTVGILCSLFTAIYVTKFLITIWYRKGQPKTLPL